MAYLGAKSLVGIIVYLAVNVKVKFSKR